MIIYKDISTNMHTQKRENYDIPFRGKRNDLMLEEREALLATILHFTDICRPTCGGGICIWTAHPQTDTNMQTDRQTYNTFRTL